MDSLLFWIYEVNFYELIAIEYRIILQILIGIVPSIVAVDFVENGCLKAPLFLLLILKILGCYLVRFLQCYSWFLKTNVASLN